MRFLILVTASAASEAGAPVLAALAPYRAALARAGVLLDAGGLLPSAHGWRLNGRGDGRAVVEGPFDATGGLVAGYLLIEVRSRDEALEWTRRFPVTPGAGSALGLEVRPLAEPAPDAPPGETGRRSPSPDPGDA